MTPFVDVQIYDGSLPQPIRDIWSLCASFGPGSIAKEALLNISLNAKTIQLIHSAKDARSFSDLLTSVQALILALIIRLFPCNLGQSPSSETLLDILGKPTFHLWQQVPAEISAAFIPHQA